MQDVLYYSMSLVHFFLFHKKRQDRLVAQLAMQNLLLPCSGNIYLKHLYQEFLKNTFVKS